MLFLFFCPASVYQQSFLGGEQTTAATTTDPPAEQYWNQQCKPIKLATFEFDFKKQRGQRQSNDNAKTRSEWKDALDPLNIRRKPDKQDRDETDFANGNHSEETNDSSAFSDHVDYDLKDINNLSQSMHDLIDKLNDNRRPRRRLMSRSAASSRNSIPEDMNASCYRSNSPLHCDKVVNKAATTPRNHRGDQKNGNLSRKLNCSDSNGDTFKIPNEIARRQIKSVRQNFSDKNRFDRFDDFRNSNATVSTSSDSLVADSSTGNDIETSDSFVNIQFAQLTRGQKSSSTQSMESTDSFENVSFRYRNNCFADRTTAQISPKLGINQDQKKSATKILQTANPVAAKSKLDNQSSEKRNYNSNSRETNKCAKNELVKLRHINKKNQVDSRNIKSNKRYSCFSAYAAKKSPEEIGGGGNGNGNSNDKIAARKFSSTDELRDEVRHTPCSTRTKRFSLYYTPQPLRKTYEGEAKTGKVVTSKPINSRVQKLDANRSKDGEEKTDNRTDKSRRSVMDASTIASRSKSNKQSVHAKPTNAVVNRTK